MASRGGPGTLPPPGCAAQAWGWGPAKGCKPGPHLFPEALASFAPRLPRSLCGDQAKAEEVAGHPAAEQEASNNGGGDSNAAVVSFTATPGAGANRAPLRLGIRSRFNECYYISGDFENGLLFSVSKRHKYNEVLEIINKNMNGRCEARAARLTSVRPGAHGAGTTRAGLPSAGRPGLPPARSWDPALRPARGRPSPHHPSPLASSSWGLEASPSALIGQRSGKGVPTPRPGLGLQRVRVGGVGVRGCWGRSVSPETLVASHCEPPSGSAARPGERQSSVEPGPSRGRLGSCPGGGRDRRGRILNQRETEWL